MAAGPTALTPPPGSPPPSPQDTSTQDAGAAPAPPTPSPQLQAGTGALIQVVRMLQAVSQQFPQTAPVISNMLNEARQVGILIMQSQRPGEPMAGPGPG